MERNIHRTLFLFSIACTLCGFASADTEPPCPGLLCLPACDAKYIPLPGTEIISVSEPNFGLIGTTIWSQCNNSNCCGTSSTCTLSIGVKTVNAGVWSAQYGIEVQDLLPPGFSIGVSSLLKFEGSESVTIDAQTAVTCSLGRCQTTDQRVGPGYTTAVKKQTIQKVCIRKVLFSCGLFSGEVCGTYEFQASSSAKFLSPQVLVKGTCGKPYAGCASCIDPLHPSCGS